MRRAKGGKHWAQQQQRMPISHARAKRTSLHILDLDSLARASEQLLAMHTRTTTREREREPILCRCKYSHGDDRDKDEETRRVAHVRAFTIRALDPHAMIMKQEPET